MKFRRFSAIVKKESLQVLRDSSTILIAVVLPLLLLFLMGYAVSLDVKNVPIGIVSKSNSHLANELVSSFRGSKYFITDEGKNKEHYKELLKSGKVKAILEIDANFGKENIYKVQLLVDATEPNLASFIQKFSSSIINIWAKNNQILKANPVQIESRYWYNSKLLSR
jgi:ABC-2 type transport system permease protein